MVTWPYRMKALSLIHILALLSAVSVPFLKNGEQALRMIRVVQAVVAALSAALLAHLWSGDSFTFMMGHFPAPWGNDCLLYTSRCV